MKLNDIPMGTEPINLLLYGSSGSGKTAFCGSAGDRTLIISPSNGLATLKSKWFHDTFKSNPFIEEVPLDDVTSAKSYDRYCDIIDLYLEKRADEIDTIIVDDATTFRRAAMNKGLELGGKLNISKTKSKMEAIKTDVVVPAVQDFGMEMRLVEMFVRGTADLCKSKGKHFILTAHERLLMEKGLNIGDVPTIRRIMPGFTGQTFPDDITGLFDMTWHTEVKGSGDKTFYQIRTQGDSVIVAKTRYAGIFPAFLEKQPLFTDVVKLIQSNTPLRK